VPHGLAPFCGNGFLLFTELPELLVFDKIRSTEIGRDPANLPFIAGRDQPWRPHFGVSDCS
jgi:hypothetical protein